MTNQTTDLNYKCTFCKTISTATEWNNATRESFGESIQPIQKANNEQDGAFFTCPNCKVECTTGLNEIEEVEKENETVTNEKTYFTTNEALQDILEVLQDGYDGYLCDLHHEVFNTDYYIIGTHEAMQALNKYGVFEAIGLIKNNELLDFGEVYTDFSNPEAVANMLYFYIGEKAMSMIKEEYSLYDELWNEKLEEEEVNNLIKVIEKLLK